MILETLMNSAVPAPGHIWHENPDAFAFGNVRWYSIFIITGFVIAILGTCMKLWKRYKISIEPFYWFILIGVPVSIFGANFGSCVLGEPAGKPWSQFWTSFGTGLAIEWGVLFCFVAGCIYFPLILKLPRYRVRDEFGPTPVVRKVSMWMYFDAIMPCVLIAQCIGRWGNYFNQEVFGSIVTNERLAWFLHDCLPYMYRNGNYYQPLFLWEMLLNLAGFLLLYVGAEFIKVRKTGDISAAYYVWYGAIRLGLEPLRDSQFKSRATMITSIVYVVCGVLFIFINHFFLARARDKKAAKALFSYFLPQFFARFFYRAKQIENKNIPNNSIKATKINCKNIDIQGRNIFIGNKITKKCEVLVSEFEYKYQLMENKYVIIGKKLDDKKTKLSDLLVENKNILAELQKKKTNDSINKELIKQEAKVKKIESTLKAVSTKLRKTSIKFEKKQEQFKQILVLHQNWITESQENLKNIKENRVEWSLPKDYLRTEQQKLFYGRW